MDAARTAMAGTRCMSGSAETARMVGPGRKMMPQSDLAARQVPACIFISVPNLLQSYLSWGAPVAAL